MDQHHVRCRGDQRATTDDSSRPFPRNCNCYFGVFADEPCVPLCSSNRCDGTVKTRRCRCGGEIPQRIRRCLCLCSRDDFHIWDRKRNDPCKCTRLLRNGKGAPLLPKNGIRPSAVSNTWTIASL